MSLYQVEISKKEKDRFYLIPKNTNLQLKKITFQCRSAEERARWFLGLTRVDGLIKQSIVKEVLKNTGSIADTSEFFSSIRGSMKTNTIVDINMKFGDEMTF
jgi:hypothetical protein